MQFIFLLFLITEHMLINTSDMQIRLCFAILHYQFRIQLSLHSSLELKSGFIKPPYLCKTELNHSEKNKFQKLFQENIYGLLAQRSQDGGILAKFFFFCMFMDQDEDDFDEILYLHSLSDVVLLLVVFFESVCRSVEGGSYDLSNLYPSFF